MRFESRPLEDRDREVVRMLRANGDALGCLRNVQHMARFAARENAYAFGKSVVKAGYHLELRDDSIHESGNKQWVVEFAVMQACDLSSVQRHTKLLEELSAKHDGEYLGWQTQPVRLRKPGFKYTP